jgi:BirA family biotin operon repressor/biotin-[acetyl-CoA-carboxylase] ligase
MKILKLDAIDSTNSYLKDLIKENDVSNWTVVVAEYQKNGKGQLDNSWFSDRGKNLTFSIIVKMDHLKVKHQHYLNYSISIALYNVLKYYIPKKLSIKWPNDILSANDKVSGILIENSIKNDAVKYAIIGIGLNVNQVHFPKDITNATSLKNILMKTLDKDELLDKILLEIQYQFVLIKQKKFLEIKQMYEDVLYKKAIPSMFIDSHNNTFLGKIIGVGKEGKLQVELENESIREFDFKEIKFT